VAPGPVPLLLGQPPQERHGVGANGATVARAGSSGDRDTLARWPSGPGRTHDEGIVFPEQVANPHVGVGLAVGTVDDDLVNRPLTRGWPELEASLGTFARAASRIRAHPGNAGSGRLAGGVIAILLP
jgi:hypothetical protein